MSEEQTLYMEELPQEECGCFEVFARPVYSKLTDTSANPDALPTARGGHTMTLLPSLGATSETSTTSQLLLFGGTTRLAVSFNTLDVLTVTVHHDPSTQQQKTTSAWRSVPLAANSPTPVPRGGHVACVHGDFLYVYGGQFFDLSTGQPTQTYMGDLWRLKVASLAPDAGGAVWEQVELTSASAEDDESKEGKRERGGHCAVVLKDTLYVIGGANPERSSAVLIVPLPDASTTSATMTVLATEGEQPKPGELFSATVVGDYITLKGGIAHDRIYDTFYKLDTTVNPPRWSLLGLAPPRGGHAYFAFRNPSPEAKSLHLASFGGLDGKAFVNTLHLFAASIDASVLSLHTMEMLPRRTGKVVPQEASQPIARVCTGCQGPYGWVQAQVQGSQKGNQQTQADGKTVLASADSATTDQKTETKTTAPLDPASLQELSLPDSSAVTDGVDIPTARFMHTVTALSPERTLFLIWGGMNQDGDLNDAFTLTFA